MPGVYLDIRSTATELVGCALELVDTSKRRKASLLYYARHLRYIRYIRSSTRALERFETTRSMSLQSLGATAALLSPVHGADSARSIF
jgi:hypothetical protein